MDLTIAVERVGGRLARWRLRRIAARRMRELFPSLRRAV
jgi:hypothetical protein